ncbi:CynX/NimT family MFS transporter [Actinophytocola sp.]|uniref:CynX/NimT family MFS transporter n=1 Tax=Actinophytocola sp. TaxID=1872138 RepID=UPI003899F0BB
MRTANEATARSVLMIAGFLLIAANLRAALTSVGPLAETIRGDLGLTSGEVGFIGTLPLLIFAAVSPQVPRLARRLGTDQALWLALVVLAVGIVLRSVPVAGMLWVGTVLLGAAIAVGNVLLPSLIKRDFPDRVSAVTGVYTAVIGIVASTAAGVAVPLAGALPGGWRTSLGCWAGLVLVALAVWTPRLTRRRRAAVPADTAKVSTPWRSLLAWECAAFMALSATGFYTVLAWYPSVLHSNGTSETTAGWLLFAYQIIGVVMSLVLPVVLSRLPDQRAVAAVSAVLAMLGHLGLLFAPGLAVVWVLVAGVGAGSVFFLALAFLSLRAADPRSAAALSGMGQSIGYLVAAVGPTLFGVLHDATGGWRVPLAVLAGVAGMHALTGLRAGRDAHVKV